MQNLCFRYTRWINWRLNRSGHLFQGRFKAILVDADAYLLELTRYLHINPLRADMVQSPEEYPWSSYRGYLGLETIPWLTTDWVLSQFSKGSDKARRDYRKFVDLGKEDGHRKEFHSGTSGDSRILGDDTFMDKVLVRAEARPKRAASLVQIVENVCREYAVELKDLAAPGKYRHLSEARGMAAWLLLESGHGTIAELGKYTERDPTTLSSAAKRLQIRAKKDQVLAVKMKELLERLD